MRVIGIGRRVRDLHTLTCKKSFSPIRPSGGGGGCRERKNLEKNEVFFIYEW